MRCTVLRDLSNPRTSAQNNFNEEIAESHLKRGFPKTTISNRYSNEDSQDIANDQMSQPIPSSLYGQYSYNQNEHSYQQMPQNRESVKKNSQNSHEQILSNQQMSLNSYQRPIQEIPEHFRQHYYQKGPGFPQNSQQYPFQGNHEQTGVNFQGQQTSQPTPELTNDEHHRSKSKQVPEHIQQQIKKFLQNIYKKPEEEIFQSSFQHGSNQDNYNNLHVYNNLDGRYSGESVSQDPAAVLYPANVYQRHVNKQNEEQVGSHRPQLYYPPNYPYNYQSFSGPKVAEYPVQDQPQSTRTIQAGAITVVQVPSDSS